MEDGVDEPDPEEDGIEEHGGQEAIPVVRTTVISCPAAPPSIAPLIERTITRHNNDLRVCYNRALRRDPTLTGRVALHFPIGGDGRVSTVAVNRSEIDDAAMMRCLAQTIKRWHFDIPQNAGTSLVTKSFVFSVPPPTRTRT